VRQWGLGGRWGTAGTAGDEGGEAGSGACHFPSRGIHLFGGVILELVGVQQWNIWFSNTVLIGG